MPERREPISMVSAGVCEFCHLHLEDADEAVFDQELDAVFCSNSCSDGAREKEGLRNA